MSVCVGDHLLCRFGWNQTCIPDGHLHRVTYNRCIDTVHSPDDEHMGARNMYKSEINIHEEELCFKLFIYKNGLVCLGDVGKTFRISRGSKRNIPSSCLLCTAAFQSI